MQKFATLLALVLVAWATPVFAEDKKDPASKPVPHGVVQVGEEFVVVETAKLKEHKKAHEKAHKEALKAWAAAKKEARKAKEKFTEPKPKPIPYRIVAPKLKDAETAQAQAAKLKEALEKAKEKKRKRKG